MSICSLQPRSEVEQADTAYHGALDYAELEELGLQPDEVLDFSVNSNPYGPSPCVQAALARVPLDRYPDREALSLRGALASRMRISPHQILIGNGVSELLLLVALAYLERERKALIVGPTFGEYARVARLMGANVVEWRSERGTDFAVDIHALTDLVTREQPNLIFLCNPNNPTGIYLPPEAVVRLVDDTPEMLWAVDEAYLAFVGRAPSVLAWQRNNVLVLRSMTKDHALAGLRLGYAVGPTEVVSALVQVRPAWNVNALAQAAGWASLADADHLRQTLRALRLEKCRLVSELKNLNLQVYPSSTHFFLVDVGNSGIIRRKLLMRGILVRDCASFGLPGFIRIATRRPQENLRLLEAIREVGSWCA